MLETILLVTGIAIIGGVIIYSIVSFARGRKDVVRERLDLYAEGDIAAEAAPAERTSVLAERLDRALEHRGFANNIRSQLARANLKITAGEFLAATVISVILFAGVAYVWKRSAIIALIAAILGFFTPRWYVNYKQRQRLNAFNKQLADVISLMTNSIRSGYSVLQAMEAVAREMAEPSAEEFGRVVREVQLGLAMEQAMNNMLRRVPSDDLDLMITAIDIQREVGGNLAEVLEAINFTIRERVRIKGEIRALTAYGRAAGYLISFLPIGLSVIMYLINPDFMKGMIEDPCGWIMIGVAVLGIVLGFLIIRKIVNIEV